MVTPAATTSPAWRKPGQPPKRKGALIERGSPGCRCCGSQAESCRIKESAPPAKLAG
jgi:hypothetical protein